MRRRVVSTFSVVWQCGHSHPNRLSVSSPFSLCHVWPHSVQVISPFGVRRPICSMQFLYPHSICAGVSGGRCLLAATTLCWNFVLGFITKIDWALVCYLRFSWVWTWLSPTWRRLRSRPSVWRSAVPRLFPPRSVQRCVITRLKLSLYYMTRTIQMIDYQKHLYFCSCHNIKIIGFAKTPLDLYLFSKNFLLVIIEALFSQRLFQSPPFWLFRQPLHIFQ